jgi:hypothetical protein
MAAPLGFKTFATGDVLTAADTNGYLMQGIWVFADATARDAAVTSPQEGNACYLKDTDNIMVYSGSAWVTKSSAAAGSNTFYAGKNKIINGDFGINQRNFTSNTTNLAYGFDRYLISFSGGTYTNTPQTFALGAAPVAGYEGKNYSRLVTASQAAAGDFAAMEQRIESVRTFAGQTVTVSMWAKASTGTPKIGVSAVQFFGNTGGSPSASVITSGGTATISTSWARYSFTMAIPSIAGKTIATSNDDSLRIDMWTSVGSTISALGYPAVGIQNATIDTWGWQIEAGSSATDFQTASGSLQGELALCQRYYQRQSTTTSGFAFGNFGTGASTTATVMPFSLKTTMRAIPTSVDYLNIALSDTAGSVVLNSLSIWSFSTADNVYFITSSTSGVTAFRPYIFTVAAPGAAYIGISADL